MKAPEAFAHLPEDQVRETVAYTLGVQTVLWGTQWVKAGETFRMVSRPLPDGATRSPCAPNPHGINTWGHAQQLLTADFRTIETPNPETLYSTALLDLEDGPIVVVHPDFGDRYFRTSLWDLHSETHTISQKQDGRAPRPYAIMPVGWTGDLPAGMQSIVVRSRYVVLIPQHRGLWRRRPAERPRAPAGPQARRSQGLGHIGCAPSGGHADAPHRPVRHQDAGRADVL
jgi:hypothetical protein